MVFFQTRQLIVRITEILPFMFVGNAVNEDAVDNVINKAYRAIWMCRRMFGKTWELKPKVV
jgi:hypothetical protein